MIIDIVYTYVDINDKDWQNEKRFFSQKEGLLKDKYINQFNSNLEEIRYSLRSLDVYFKNKYRNIYFVTNNGKLPHFVKKQKHLIPIHYKTLLNCPSFNSKPSPLLPKCIILGSV